MYAMAVKRGCGTRKKGGVYWEVGMGPDGMPLEHFLIDPPTPLPEEYQGMSRQGVTTYTDPKTGVTHVLDWVGEEHYPNVMDFTEEVRRFGLSRRIPKNFDFSLITEKSRILLIHRRAIIRNCYEYPAPDTCPKQYANHTPEADPDNYNPRRFCIGHWRMDLTIPEGEGGEVGGEAAEGLHREHEGKTWKYAERRCPSFNYAGFMRPDEVEPTYTPGIFASFPCGRLVVVKDDDDSHMETFDKMLSASVPLDIVEQ